jgi:hypothetical protein
MKAWIEAVTLAGPTVRVSAREPLPADGVTLAVAGAIRLMERFPILDELVLAGAHGELSVTRADVERLLAPEGFSALQERPRWPQVLARAVQRYTLGAAEDPA